MILFFVGSEEGARPLRSLRFPAKGRVSRPHLGHAGDDLDGPLHVVSRSRSRTTSPVSSSPPPRPRTAARACSPSPRSCSGTCTARTSAPDVFPFDTTIFTGKISEERMKHEHPLEYERLMAEERAKTEAACEGGRCRGLREGASSQTPRADDALAARAMSRRSPSPSNFDRPAVSSLAWRRAPA
jgi:hypothetical protein